VRSHVPASLAVAGGLRYFSSLHLMLALVHQMTRLTVGYTALPLSSELTGKPVDWAAERRSFPWEPGG
jgi:hypothetical protein